MKEFVSNLMVASMAATIIMTVVWLTSDLNKVPEEIAKDVYLESRVKTDEDITFFNDARMNYLVSLHPETEVFPFAWLKQGKVIARMDKKCQIQYRNEGSCEELLKVTYEAIK